MSLKRLLLSAAAASLLAGPALADGGPTPEPPPPPPPPPEEDSAPPPPPPPPPPAFEPGFYAEAEGGVAFVDELEATGFPEEMDTGYNFGGALGMHMTPNVDVEVEVFDVGLGYACCDIDLNALSTMVNVLYNFGLGGMVDPYLGAGLGAVRVKVEDPFISDSAWQFGYQAMGGLMMNVSSNVGIFAEYRFHDAVGEPFIFGEDIEYHSHNVSGGIQVSF